jgi:hypothetical protein
MFVVVIVLWIIHVRYIIGKLGISIAETAVATRIATERLAAEGVYSEEDMNVIVIELFRELNYSIQIQGKITTISLPENEEDNK